MPPVKKKPIAPVKPTPPPVKEPAPVPVNPDGLRVVFPTLSIEEYSTASAKGPLTADLCAKALGWETEDEFIARKLRENPNDKPEKWMSVPSKKDVFGDTYHCKNEEGKKVRCNNNANNRPFDESWCAALVETILKGQWAGPHTLPGETVNGETVRISRYGRVVSAQHQMTACKLADEHLQKYRKQNGLDAANARYPAWAKHNHVFIETIVVKGLSEDPRVLMTVDYVKPRSAADVFYTSEVFQHSSAQERRELCKMLASAVDFLWTRTAARGYRTHPEVVGFLERHKKLMDCVLHLFKENNPNAGRRISKLRLQPGTCAGIMYLQACGTPETTAYSDEYRNESPAPSEKKLDFSLWDKAEDFWTLLGAGLYFEIVRRALAHLIDSTPGNEDNTGLGGRADEKLAILAHAWDRWRDHADNSGAPFDDSDLAEGGLLDLSYSNLNDKGDRLPDGQVKLVDIADFMGIDCPKLSKKDLGATDPPDPPAPTREEIEAAAEAARKRRAAQK